MQFAAINWHVYLLTKSAFARLVGLFRGLPIILCSLAGGVVADAIDRKGLMMVTQTVMLAESGPAVTWGINALSFIAVIVALLAAVIGAPLSVVVGGLGSVVCAAFAAVKSKSLMKFEM